MDNVVLYLLIYTAISVVALSLLYTFYVLLMDYLKFQGVKKKGDIKGFKNKSLVYLFFIFDTACNWLVFSIWSLFDFPQELTVTSRMKRWRKVYSAKPFNELSAIQQDRLLFAIWICDTKLDRDDILNEGNHC